MTCEVWIEELAVAWRIGQAAIEQAKRAVAHG